MKDYSKHCFRWKCAALFFLLYGAVISVPKYTPFPFFNWSLFVATPEKATVYDVLITATSPDRKLAKPIPLNLLDPEFHRDWYPSPYRAIQRLGWLTDDFAWQSPLLLSEKYLRDYFTMGFDRSKQDMVLARGAVENYLRDIPYVEYDIVKTTYDVKTHYHYDAKPHWRHITSYRKMSVSP